MQAHPIVTRNHPLATCAIADVQAQAQALFAEIVQGLTKSS
jgi:hypothetical protein